MKKIKVKWNAKLWRRFILSLLIIVPYNLVWAQKANKYEVAGTVYEIQNGKKVPLPFATLSLSSYAINAVASGQGAFYLKDVPVGKTKLTIKYIGKVEKDTLIDVKSNLNIHITMDDENFKLKDVIVTAQNKGSGMSSSSSISSLAMEHLQATSLNDVLSLIPGGIMDNQTLNKASQVNLRTVSSTDMNSLGAALIQDGAPISNNANMQMLNPTLTGGAVALGGGASASGGVDLRNISIENIESVEVLRGIPSVQYGDLTSGAVILHSKAGSQPLRIRAKINPNVSQVSLGGGYSLGRRKGALNVSMDYAYNEKEPIESYLYYQRINAKVLYSNTFFNNRLHSNTSLSFIYGKDTRKKNPDDKLMEISSKGKNTGGVINTNGMYIFNNLWLKNIKYVASFSYTKKDSHYESDYLSANAPYSMTTTDGAILSNTAGKSIYDADGKEITNISTADKQNYAVYLPSTYHGAYDIDGKEMNTFANLSANFFKRFGKNVNNRFLIGGDFKSDGNKGKGKTFDPTNPPLRNLSYSNSSSRPRKYSDIPFINQFSAFAEENLNWVIAKRELKLQAGVRYDHVSVAGGIVTPRFNASYEVVPEILNLRCGYGVTAKMPTLLYLHPENAYFEYINLNEMSDESIAEADRTLITTTKVYDSCNPDLKIAKNKKSEIGFDLRAGRINLSVTAFKEDMNNGYMLAQTLSTFKPFTYNEYGRNSNGDFVLDESNPVLSTYHTPTNNAVLKTKGLEFSLDLGRFDAIRTSFSINGAWMRSKSYNSGYTFYDNSGTGGSDRKDVAIYAQGMQKYNNERMSTSLRITHNIPSIGFVVTLTTQAIWKEANWYNMGNDSIPIGYVSKTDGSSNFFANGEYTTRQQLKDEGKNYLLRNVTTSNYIKESYSPLFCFSLNLTKEINDDMRVSFFANNMFRSYPIVASKRDPGSYTKRNTDFFFGMEFSLLLK